MSKLGRLDREVKYTKTFFNRAWEAMADSSSAGLQKILESKNSMVGRFLQQRIVGNARTARSELHGVTESGTHRFFRGTEDAFDATIKSGSLTGGNRRTYFYSNKSMINGVGGATSRYAESLYKQKHTALGMALGAGAGWVAGSGNEKDPRQGRGLAMATAGAVVGGFMGRRVTKLHTMAFQEATGIRKMAPSQRLLRRGTSRQFGKKLNGLR